MAVPTVYTSNRVDSYIAVGSQTQATVPATTYQFTRWLDGAGITHDRVVTVEREGGDGQDLNISYVEHHFANANVVEYARPDTLLRKLAYVFGQSSVVATSPVYQHEIIPLPDPRLITVEQFAPGQAIGERIYDSVMQELTLEHNLGKPLKITSLVIGGNSPQSIAVGSARTVALDAEPPFLFWQGSITVTVAGVAAADDSITDWTFKFARTLDDNVQGVGLGRQAIAPLHRDITMNIRRRFVDPTAHNAIMYAGGSVGAPTQATGAFKAAYAYSVAGGGSYRYFELEIPLAAITGITRNIFEKDGQTVYESIDMTAMKGATWIVRAMAKNAVATHIASGAL